MRRKEADALFDATHGLYLAFAPSLRVQSVRGGDWESTSIGEGFEFEELRELQPGEDRRHLNARASARAQKTLVTKRTELREARVIILFDASPSMYLRDKMSMAFSAAAIIMHSTLALHMPLGLWFVGDTHDIEVHPKMGEQHFYTVNETLVDAVCNEHALNAASESEFPLDGLRSFLSRGSFLFVISDFLRLDDNDLIPTILSETEGFDVIPVIIQDELEYSFPDEFGVYGSAVQLFDIESGEMREVWLNAETAREKREVHEARFGKLLRRFRDKGLLYAHVSTRDVAIIFDNLQAAL